MLGQCPGWGRPSTQWPQPIHPPWKPLGGFSQAHPRLDVWAPLDPGGSTTTGPALPHLPSPDVLDHHPFPRKLSGTQTSILSSPLLAVKSIKGWHLPVQEATPTARTVPPLLSPQCQDHKTGKVFSSFQSTGQLAFLNYHWRNPSN